MATTPIRIATIGTGGIARSHQNGYKQILAKDPGLFVVVAVCDPVLSAAEAFANQVAEFQGTKPTVYTDVNQLLEKEQLDGADICSPHFLHHTLGIACMDAGVNVMIEKPIGITVKATQQLIKKQEATGLICATAENIRRQPAPRAAHWAINERKLIGDPMQFFIQLGRYNAPKSDSPWHWRAAKLLGGGGLAIDSGAHFCDTVRYLFGDVESVYGKTFKHGAGQLMKDGQLVPDDREDSFVAILNFESGLVGTWSFGYSLPAAGFNSVVYYGTKGALSDPGDPFHGPRMTAEWRFADGTARTMENVYNEYLEAIGKEGQEKYFPMGMQDGFALEVYDFVTAIRDNRSVEIPVQEGLMAKAIAQTLYESAATGKLVKVKDVLAGVVDEFQRPINESIGL